MGIRYDRTNWENEKTPVNQDNMNNIELGIVNATDAINKLLDGILPVARAIADEDGNNLKMTLINKADLIDGKVPANQLPSYVSNIVEVDTYEDLPNPGEGSTIYVVKNPVETTYRWTGSTYISTDEQSQYYSVKIDTSNIITMGDLYDYITNINNSGLHCFFDLSDFIENAYTCTVLMFTKNLINYCLIFDIINGKTYIDYNGYQTTDLVQDYVNRTGDNIPRIISLNDSNLLVRDIATLLDEINVVGHHVIFDFHELQANCYLCTVLIDTQNNQITIADLVGFRIVTRNYDEYTTVVSLLENLEQVGDGGSEVVSITYSELLALKTAGDLSPGTFYRIIDYQTTVPASMKPVTMTTYVTGCVRSAGHQFDIIIQAITNDKFDENAHAALHSGDTYFTDADVRKWVLKYDIDGTLHKYDWSTAGTESFRGIIFYMKDQYDNECYFDFKNIQFRCNCLYEWSQMTWYSNYNWIGSQYVYLFCRTDKSSGSMSQNDIIDCSQHLFYNDDGINYRGCSNCKVGVLQFNKYQEEKDTDKYRLNFSAIVLTQANGIIIEKAYGITIRCYGQNYLNLYGFSYNIISTQNAQGNITNSNNVKLTGSQISRLNISGSTNIELGFNARNVSILASSYIIAESSSIAYSTIDSCNHINLYEAYSFWFSYMDKYCCYINIYSGHRSIKLTSGCCYLNIGKLYSQGAPRTNDNCSIIVKHVGGKDTNNKIQLIDSFTNDFDGEIVYEGYGRTEASSYYPIANYYTDYKIVAKLTDKNNVTNVYQYDTTSETWSLIKTLGLRHYRHHFTATFLWTNSQHVTSKNCFLQATFENTSPTAMTWSDLVEATLEQGKTLYYEYTDQNMSRTIIKRIDVSANDNTKCLRTGYSTYNAGGTIYLDAELISTVKAYDFVDFVDTVEQLD